ncbi:putative 1-acylglycerol-3-phosphate acyltransferase [Xylona heveae TC161]|uniref:1-acyl-sn-glycerol-3-phosphate acyltransferase n=1 Tax=Xylona heveae (strain CBS 132557 / TC161) TaxID=1328760 RepID=A0A165G3C6_XYLHT|nr:putative 1-acylglycerol-3-phosphate acyltransferase [Xylona heveae TC161]KZF21691.1 putative 1-acylglycerol-3-phosphate acyltransferase [Xylona heveae TC161]
MSFIEYVEYFLAIYVAITLMLFVLSLGPLPKCGFYARLLASYLSLIGCATYGVVASIVLRLVGYGRVSQWATARSFKWVMRYTTGVEFVVDRKENLQTRPAVFIGNHQTELDVLMLGEIFPPYCSVTAKKSLKAIPFLGWFMALSGTVFIDRANRQTALAAFESAAAEIRREKQSVFIFPEGTRSYSTKPDLLPFKKGAFHLAVKAQVPIVPIVVANYSNVLNVKERKFTSGQIPVKVLDPIPTTNLTSEDVDDLTTRTREIMLKELIQLNQTATSASPFAADAARHDLDASKMATGASAPISVSPAVASKASGIDRVAANGHGHGHGHSIKANGNGAL